MSASRVFRWMGKLCGTAPWTVSLLSVVIAMALSGGMLKMQLESNPERIWVPPNSEAMAQQNYFDAQFGKFFRIEQLIFRVPDHSGNLNMIQKPFLERLFSLQEAIRNARIVDVANNESSISLSDLCYRPIAHKGCLIESPMQYWLNNRTILRNDPDIMLTTACQTTDPVLSKRSPCMDENGIPVMKNVVFGGISTDPEYPIPDPCGEHAIRASALIVTFLLLNPTDEASRKLVEQWEKQVFLRLAEEFNVDAQSNSHETPSTTTMHVSYMAQRSVSDALEAELSENVWVAVLSYAAMWIYVSLSLGSARDIVQSRCLLSCVGIATVMLSVTASIGICSFVLHEPVTMIVVEVVPFLILAIGVDNMFIISAEFDRISAQSPSLALTLRLEQTMAHAGPSIATAAITECAAFLVGALTGIPALQSFCLVAAVAVGVDFALQITLFASALLLDAYRREQNRFDVFPCFKRTRNNTVEYTVLSTSKDLATTTTDTSCAQERVVSSAQLGVLEGFVRRTYAPFILQPTFRKIVMGLYVAMLCVSLSYVPSFELGLEQQVALPSDFYLTEFFNVQAEVGEAGPPAYIVLQKVNYTDEVVQKDVLSLLDDISRVQKYVETPIYAWINTFVQWRAMRKTLEELVNKNKTDCPSQRSVMDPFPFEQTQEQRKRGAPTSSLSLYYGLVKNFTGISIDSSCCQHFGFCGEQFVQDIAFEYEKNTNYNGSSTDKPYNDHDDDRDSSSVVVVGIEASRFRFQTTLLNNQSQFINSYYYISHFTSKWSSSIPVLDSVFSNDGTQSSLGRHDDLSTWKSNSLQLPNSPAFAYSLYFIYYEQYKYIQGVAIQNIILALGAVFTIVMFATGADIRISLWVVWTVASICICLAGVLGIWNSAPVNTLPYALRINAVSVVNLIMAIGLSLEFCIHLTNAYQVTKTRLLSRATTCASTLSIVPTYRETYALEALKSVGASVLKGITITKFVGISVLAFSPSVLYRLYFFRMYMAVIFVGAVHGLVLLPIWLSLFGPVE